MAQNVVQDNQDSGLTSSLVNQDCQVGVSTRNANSDAFKRFPGKLEGSFRLSRYACLPVPGQKDAAYKSALLLVAEIDEGLTHRTRHYYTRAGVLLSSLDSVIVAILNDDLLTTS